MMNIQEAAFKELNKKVTKKDKFLTKRLDEDAKKPVKRVEGAEEKVIEEAKETGHFAIQHKNGRWVSRDYVVGNVDRRAKFENEKDAEAFISDNGKDKNWQAYYSIVKLDEELDQESGSKGLTRAFGGQYIDLYDEVYDALSPDLAGMNQKAKDRKVLVNAFTKYGEPYTADEVFAMVRVPNRPNYDGIKIISQDLARAKAVADAFGLEYEVNERHPEEAHIYIPGDAKALKAFVKEP